MNLSDTSIEATPTKTNRSALQYSPRDELDLSRSNSSQADSIVSLTARENAQLRTENERLEQENEKLEQENERLEEENVHLKKELARLKGTNLKERRCLKPWSQLGRERKRRLLKDILGTVQNVADHYETSVICVSANIMYRGAFAVKRYDILKIARKIEANASLKEGKGKMPELVASWLILRGKGGGLSKVVYRQIKKVFRLEKLCVLPDYQLVTDYWHSHIMTPITTTIEGSSTVLFY